MRLRALIAAIANRLRRHMRRHVSVGLMIVAALITPTPDPLNMLLVWAALYLLFELGLLLTRGLPPPPPPIG